jgi:iron(III) transport system permease protein
MITTEKHSYWFWSTLLTASLVSLPIIAITWLALFPEQNIWPHLSSTVLPFYLRNTFILMLGVGLLALAIGTGSAWLISMYDFPGRRWLSWALLLPFAVPAYVIAYVYTDLMEFTGPIQSGLRELFGWQSARDYWFPHIRSMGGAILVMGMVLYPYIYMLARASFLEQSASLHRVARSLGSTHLGYFWRVSLPIARPAIAVGLALVLMETLNDFGTVDFFAVKTLTAGLYDTWLNMGSLGGAAQIALLMVGFVVALISVERHSRRQQRHYHSRNAGEPLQPNRLHGWKAWAASSLAFTPVVLGFLIPVSVLSLHAVRYFEQSWNEDFNRLMMNSFALSATAALVALILGLILAYARRLDRTTLTAALTQISSLGYAVPGAALAIGVIIPFASFDNWLDDQLRIHFDISTWLLLSGSVFAILFAYVVRFLAVSTGSVESSLDKVTLNMDMAARSLGKSRLETLLLVHLPIIRRGALTAMLVVFVDCMKELPATLILRPFNFDTLATQVYQYASDQLIEMAALSALVIVLVGILPVILLDRSITRVGNTQT